MSGPTVNTIRYYNSYNQAVVLLYPMVTASSDPSARIWNGRDDGHQWRQAEGNVVPVALQSDPPSWFITC
jgi:hypothetical protein